MEYIKMTLNTGAPSKTEYTENSRLGRMCKLFNIKELAVTEPYESNVHFVDTKITLQTNKEITISLSGELMYNLCDFAKKNNLTDLEQVYALYLLSKED